MRKIRISAAALTGLLVIGLAGALFAAQSPAKAPAAPAAGIFLKPSGPYAVGVHDYLWIDAKRGEPFTKDPSDHRRLLARVWYPALPQPGQVPALFVPDIREYPEASIYRKAEGVRTNGVTDAPLVAIEGRLPVLVYEPGGGMARFTATFLAEQLASRGYVVVASDHPGFSETALFPDGFKFKADQMVMPSVTGPLKDAIAASQAWLSKDVFPTWTADASFTLDKVVELEATPGQVLFHRLDLDRIGMLGWSFGGATSIQMSKDDPRVKAAMDQDGQLFGDVWQKGTSRPVMLWHHGEKDKAPKPEDQPFLEKMMNEVEGHDRAFLSKARADWYDLTIARTQHGHFSDLTLFFPPAAGQLEARRAHEIIVAYTLAFFDKYLRGRDSRLLKGPSAEYPEVAFRKK